MIKYNMIFRMSIVLAIGVLSLACGKEKNSQESTIHTTTPQPTAVVSEEFRNIDPVVLNNIMKSQGRKMTYDEIAALIFIPGGEIKGNVPWTIEEQMLSNGNKELTIIHTMEEGNPIAAEKFLIVIAEDENNLVIKSLKKNWKCTKERTYQEWGIGDCPI